jgi:hypothetical protein
MKTTARWCSIGLLTLIAWTAFNTSYGQRFPARTNTDPNTVTPGEFLIEPPTLQNLGFEWFIDGDANRNASVMVSYRESGSDEWLPALPLLRLGGERISSGAQLDVLVPPMFAGSVLDLEPDTAYQVRFLFAA